MDTTKDYNRRIMVREISTKKNHLISVFNNFEVTFSDKKKKYFDKLESLPAAWEQICNFVFESSAESPQPQFESLFLYTLKFVLRADWRHASKATKTHLTLTLQRLINELTSSKNHMSILPQCRVLESVINEPWDHPVLKKIFQDEETTVDELIDYFHLENGKVVVARLEMLLESKCEDLAFRLSKSCLMTYNSTHPLELDLNQNEYNYIMDMYLCCSFKIKNTSDLIAEMKNFDLCEGLQLLRRYRLNGGVAGGYNDSCKEARIWKSSKKTIELISNTLLANAVLHDDLDDSDVEFLQGLISEWASVHTTSVNEIFAPVPSEVMRKCVLIARCSKCIYPFCSFLMECGGKEKDINLVTRCLIRAINQNMNEIEQYRVNTDRDKLKLAYELLCKGFILISSLFSEYKNIYKECLLTAFSITPSREYLEKMEQFITTESSEKSDAKPKVENNNEISVGDQNETQKTVLSDEQTPAEVTTKSSEIDAEKSEIDAEKTEQTTIKTDVLDDSLSSDGIRGHAPAYLTEVESLQVEESLKTDLNSILRYQRYHALTWDLEWGELKSNCEKYLEIFVKRGFDEVELKYLDLDYEQFKNKPNPYEDFGGIEKGYEQYVLYSDYTDEEADILEKSSLTSDETDFDDEDYGRRKRKKQKAKKKRPKLKPKVEYSETDDWEDIHDVENVEPTGRETRSRKKRRKRLEECDLKLQRKRGRPRKTLETNEETSDANIDSQSENQPPPINDTVADEDGVHENISNAKSNSNNLQMLRQFRMNASKCEEESADKVEKSCKDIFVNGNRLQQLQICIPKCDAMTVNGTLNLNLTGAKKRKYESDEEVEKHDKKMDKTEGNQNDESESVKNELVKPPSRRLKPQSSATLHHPSKSFSNQKLKKQEQRNKFRSKRHQSKYMLKKQRKLAVPPVGHFTGDSLAGLNDMMSDIFGDLLKDSEIRVPEKSEETFAVPENIPTSPLVTKSSCITPTPNTTCKKPSYLVSSSEEIKPPQLPFTSKSAATEPKASLSVMLSPLKSSDYTLPKSSPVYTTLVKPVSSPLPSFAKISPLKSTALQIPSYNELPVQSTSSTSHVNNLAVSRILNYNERPVQSASSTSSVSNAVSSYLTSSIDKPYSNTARDPRLKPQSSFSSPSVPTSISSLLPSESLYPVVRIPNIRSAISTSQTMYNTQYSSSSSQPSSRVTYSQNFTSSNRLTSSSTAVTTNNIHSKLRQALQKQPINDNRENLYASSNPVNNPAKDDDMNVVNQILGEYRQTISQHPELEHVPAQRRRSNANPSRRQRKSKKESAVTKPSSTVAAVTNAPPPSEMQRYYPKATSVPSSISTSFVNSPAVSQMPNIQMMSQTSTTSSQLLQTSRPNVCVPSNAVQKLPSYSTSGGSSQNYNVSGYENVSSSYVSNGPTITVNGYPENIIAQTNMYANNVPASMTSMHSNVNSTAVTSNVNVINGSHVIQNSLYANQSYAINSQSNPTEMPVSNANLMNSGNDCGVDNSYKPYSYPQTMHYDSRNTVITSSSNNYKNVVQMNNSRNVNSTMVSGNMNSNLKTPMFYATVSNDVSNVNDQDSPCISIPEEQYTEPYFGSYLALIEDNALLPQNNENVYLKTENVTSSNGQNVQLISATTHIPKQDAQGYDHSVLFNVGDLFYPFPQ